MPILIILVTVVLYAAALFLWVRTRVYSYTIVLLAGHLLAFLDPLWQRLYVYQYAYFAENSIIFHRPVPWFVIIGAGWLYSLPGLVLCYSYARRWWPRQYLAGLAAFLAMVLYHLIAQGIGKQTGLWGFNPTVELLWNIPYWLFIAILGGLVSFLIGAVVNATRQYAGIVLIPTLSAGIIAMPVLVYGILGAPFWLPLLLDESLFLVTLGALLTLALTAWVVHLVCGGLRPAPVHAVR